MNKPMAFVLCLIGVCLVMAIIRVGEMQFETSLLYSSIAILLTFIFANSEFDT